MAGIYVHVPFCKKICSYCDFYKTVFIALIPEYLRAVASELEMRNDYLQGDRVETVYFGGGTPSLLTAEQINQIIEKIHRTHQVSKDCEITLEVNPDDLTTAYLESLIAYTPVNRISIGIQAFNDNDLALLNRRHNARQAIMSIENARKAGFRNISIDLIYGLPGMDTRRWQNNLDLAFSLGIEHLSAYHLSIEPDTALSRLVLKGSLKIIDEKESNRQFNALSETAIKNGFIHYEISNLAKAGFLSQHNSNYWKQRKYLGIGPSAHSYNIVSRQWNIDHTEKYIAAIGQGGSFFKVEELDIARRFNEYLMISLRTCWGVNSDDIQRDFGEKALKEFLGSIQSLESSGHLVQDGKIYKLTGKGWLISDYILSRLMKD